MRLQPRNKCKLFISNLGTETLEESSNERRERWGLESDSLLK